MILDNYQAASFINEIDIAMTKTFGISLLRPEFRLVLSLIGNNGISIKESMSISQLSYRGFYLMMGKLMDKNIIRVDDDEVDKRVRKVTLCDEKYLMSIIDGRIKYIKSTMM